MNPQGDHTQPAASNSPNTHRRWPWRFVLIIAALATGIAFVSQARSSGGHDQVKWRYSYNQASIEADENAKPLFVMFTADWCPPCKQMKAWVFSDSSIADSIEAGFVPVKIDLTSEGLPDQRIADRYGVQSIPTLMTLTADGKPISISTGYLSKDELLTWLDNATERYAELKSHAANDSATAYVEETQAN